MPSSHLSEKSHQNMTFARRKSIVIAPRMWTHYIVKLKQLFKMWMGKKNTTALSVTLQSCLNIQISSFFLLSRVKTCQRFPNPKTPLRLHHITRQINHMKRRVETVRNHEIFHLRVVRYWVQLAGVRFKAPFCRSGAGFSYSIATVQGALCACVIKTCLKDLV